MKLSEIREAYEELSGIASKLNRNLCFAGFALIWIFNPLKKYELLDSTLILPALFFVISLATDLTQYVVPSLIWYFYYIKQKKRSGQNKLDEEIIVAEPESNNIYIWYIFVIKIIFMLVGFTNLFIIIL